MKQISSFLHKGFTFKERDTLFELPLLEACQQGRCAFCGNKLYPMMNRKLMWCKNKRHPKFVVSKDKIK